MVTDNLDYARPSTPIVPGSPSLCAIAAIIAFLAAVVMTVYGFSRMDGERLFWEGGNAYFLAEFPFITVWSLCGIGALLATIAILPPRKVRGPAVAALVLNLLWAAWYLRSYTRNAHSVQQSGYVVPAFRW